MVSNAKITGNIFVRIIFISQVSLRLNFFSKVLLHLQERKKKIVAKPNFMNRWKKIINNYIFHQQNSERSLLVFPTSDILTSRKYFTDWNKSTEDGRSGDLNDFIFTKNVFAE